MADEFAKGFTIFSAAGMLWMILAAWYRTPEFDGPQLTEPVPENPGTYDAIGIILMDAMVALMILGPITFWFLIPAYQQAKSAYADRNAE